MPKTKGKQKKDLKQKPQSNGSGLFVWIAMAFFVILTLSILPNDTENEIEISYNSYQQLLSAGKIEKATIEREGNNNSFHATLSDSMLLINKNGAEFENRTRFVVILPPDFTDQQKIWDASGIEYNFDRKKLIGQTGC